MTLYNDSDLKKSLKYNEASGSIINQHDVNLLYFAGMGKLKWYEKLALWIFPRQCDLLRTRKFYLENPVKSYYKL